MISEKVESEVSVRVPSGDAEWAVGGGGAAFRGSASLETINLEVTHAKMVLSVKFRGRREESRGRTESWDPHCLEVEKSAQETRPRAPFVWGVPLRGTRSCHPQICLFGIWITLN